jgi:hypothetical protein
VAVKARANLCGSSSRQYLSLKVRKFIDFLVKEVEKFKLAIEQLPTPEPPLVAYKQLIKEK